MNLNDLFLVITWVVGLGGAAFSYLNMRKRLRSQAKLELDLASFKGARTVIDLLEEQLIELREELKVMRGEYSALRAREGKLLRRIQKLEAALDRAGLPIPNGDQHP